MSIGVLHEQLAFMHVKNEVARHWEVQDQRFPLSRFGILKLSTAKGGVTSP